MMCLTLAELARGAVRRSRRKAQQPAAERGRQARAQLQSQEERLRACQLAL